MTTQTHNCLPSLKQCGFTIIEAMIAFAVAGVGILAVVSLQTELIATSGYSKARAEALQLAQERIAEFKNYSFTSAVDFNTSTKYATTDDTVTSNDETIDGTNARFTRDYTIADGTTAQIRNIVVTVSWDDAKGVGQNVTLNTSITYESQILTDALESAQPPIVSSAAGTATIGAGTVDCGTGEGQIACSGNGDGTAIVVDGDDLKLVIDDGTSAADRVVLTLQDACVTGICTQFVQIRGSVYIDKTTQDTLTATEVNLLASNASYCQRFYLSDGGSAIAATVPVVSNTDTNITTYYIETGTIDGIFDSTTDTTVLTATTDLTGAPSTPTPSENYQYYRYSCYLGGGWHGNVGIILSGGNSDTDKFCLGDPTTTAPNYDDKPVIAARRVYRGMTYKYLDTTVEPLVYDINNVETYTLSGGGTDYQPYSQGIRDGAQIDGQDFVIGALKKNLVDGDYCVTTDGPVATLPFSDDTTQARGIMTRADSTEDGSTLLTKAGTLFAGVPDDWVCLNEGGLIAPELPFGYKSTCPYNPTSPPNTVYVVSGTITVTPVTVANWQIGSYTDPDLDTTDLTNLVYTDTTNVNLEVNTSQNIGNCTLGDYTEESGPERYSTTYSCKVYDWELSGWSGVIAASSDIPNSLSCLSKTIPTITADLAGQDITCSEVEPVIVSGTSNIVDGLATLASVTITGGTPVGCSIAADSSSYECTTLIDVGGSWTGTVEFTNVDGNFVCHDYAYANVDSSTTSDAASFTGATESDPFVASYSALSAGTYSDEDIQIESDSSQCP